MMNMMKIAVIGVGNLGRVIANKLAERFDVMAIEKDPDTMRRLENPKIKKSDKIASAQICDVAIICVKPGDVKTVLTELNPSSSIHIISCAAGTRMGILKGLGAKRLSRIMPNINIEVDLGLIGYSGEDVTDIFSGFAVCIPLEEDQINLITALSASGVAYIWYLTKAFYEYAEQRGIRGEQAKHIVGNLLKGCGEMLLNDGRTIEALISTVATPKGTTAAGLEQLERSGVPNAIKDALKMTEERCRQIEASHDVVGNDGRPKS